MDRRKFLKVLGGGAVAAAAVAVGCDNPQSVEAGGFSVGEVPTGRMTYRTDSHGVQVSLLGYGCMRWPTVSGDSGRESSGELDQEQINRLVDYAIDHGVNLFDTAPPYCQGRSEHAVGIALSRHPRSSYLISTKLSNFNATTWSREVSVRIFRNSLRELQVDYIDYLMLHGVGMPSQDLQGNTLSGMEAFQRRYIDNGILDFLQSERSAGRIRNLGFSYHGDVQVFDHLLSLHDTIRWDHVLIQHNYLNWQHAQEVTGRDANSEYLYGELARRDIPVFVMEPLLGGRLSTLPDYAVDLLKQRAPQSSVASWAFRFAGTMPRILTVLSGMTYMEYLQDNIRTYAPLRPLDDADMALLHDIAESYVRFPFVPCTDCKYCMPCPFGIDIPGNFAYYNRCLNEGLLVDAGNAGAERRSYRRHRRAYLSGYNRAVETMRQADRCIACGQCLVECPQGIDIPSQLQRIESYTRTLRDETL